MTEHTKPWRRVYGRYGWRMAVSSAVYILAIALISGWLGWQPPRTGPVVFALALLPMLGVGGMIWSMGQCILGQDDEFLRLMHMRTALGAIGLTLFVTTAWGFVGWYAHVWTLPLYLVFPLYCMAQAIVQPIVWLRYR